MKCVLNPVSGEIKRLNDAEAAWYVAKYRWQYAPKTQYKAYLKSKEVGRAKGNA